MKKALTVLLAVVMCVSFASAVLAQGARGTSGTYSWTGFYAGLNAGYGFGGNNSVDLAPVSSSFVPVFRAGGVGNPDSLNPSGFVGGVQVGYNYQFNRLLLGGLEADIQYADVHDSKTATAQGSGGFAPEETSVDQRLKWLGTVRARLGVLPVDRLLLYVTGGLAYGKVDRTATIAFPGIPQIFSGSENTTRAGWTLGGGLEWAFFKNWSAKAEYLYYDLGSQDVDIVTVTSSVAGTASGSFETRGHIVRAGLNYKF